MHVLGLEFGSAAQLSKRPGSVWNCLCGNALKRSSGIIRKSRVSYPVPGFLSSATWPSLPEKYYNGLKKLRKCIILFKETTPNICIEVLDTCGYIQYITSAMCIILIQVQCVNNLD